MTPNFAQAVDPIFLYILAFLDRIERDEGEREQPCDQYPWDGVSGVRPFRGLAATTTVGVY